MSITLGGIALDSRLLLKGTFDSPRIVTSQKITLGGARNISVAPLTGRVLSLSSGGPNGVNFGFFTRAQLDGLATIRDQGLPVTLTHHTEIFQVFMQGDCLAVSPITETTLKSTDDWFSGTITLIEV